MFDSRQITQGGRRPWRRIRTVSATGAALLWLCAAASAGQAGAARLAPSTTAAVAAVGDPPPPELPDTIRRDEAGRVTVRAVRAATPLKIDGVLNEEVYATVRPIDGFIQQDPNPGQPATEPTDVWILFDDQYLYVSARCHDSHPERMVANEMRRDGSISQNENFTISIDTFHDRRNGFLFQTNPLGALRDALITDEGPPNNDWNTVWYVRVEQDEKGWTVEMAIPFKSLRYGEAREQVWGVSIRRVVRWKNEFSHMTAIPPSFGGQGIWKVSMGGTLVGIEAPMSSRPLEVKPYAITSMKTDRTAEPAISNDPSANVGVDVKYGLSRGLTADFTYNTDFAQVEQDDQQVNLTRFSLLFPEKRDFFLEGQGIFGFGGASGGSDRGGGEGAGGGIGATNVTPIMFFSRQIGLAEAEDSTVPVPIVAGGRVTGRAGAYTLGLLNIETGRDEPLGLAATNYSVVRVRRDILRRSTIGIIGTNRIDRTEGAGANQAFGVDANFAFYKTIEARVYYARTRDSGQTATGNAASYLGEFVYNADRYGFVYQHLTVGDEFNPGIGFLRRSDFRRNFGGVRFSPRPKSSKIVRKYMYEANLDYITNGGHRLESRETQASFGIEFQNSDRFRIEHTRNYEYLDEAFDIASDVTLPVNVYSFQQTRASYNLGPQRRVQGNLSAGRGTFYDGTRTELGYGGRIEVTHQLVVEPRLTLNLVKLPEGNFTKNVLGSRVTFTVTPRTFLSGLVQYNTANDTLSTNIRFRWEYQPGSDFFVVYNEGRDTGVPGTPPALETRALMVKLTRFFRF